MRRNERRGKEEKEKGKSNAGSSRQESENRGAFPATEHGIGHLQHAAEARVLETLAVPLGVSSQPCQTIRPGVAPTPEIQQAVRQSARGKCRERPPPANAPAPGSSAAAA